MYLQHSVDERPALGLILVGMRGGGGQGKKRGRAGAAWTREGGTGKVEVGRRRRVLGLCPPCRVTRDVSRVSSARHGAAAASERAGSS